jgi:hypothetical protein
VEGVKALAFVVDTYPQTAYAGLQKAYQQQWKFVQSVVEGTGESFTPLQKAITEDFVPALFRDTLTEKDDVCLQLYCLTVKQAGLALPDPTKSAPSKYEASTCVNSHLIAALKCIEDISALTHVVTIKEVRSELVGRKKVSDGLILTSILSTVPPLLKRAL